MLDGKLPLAGEVEPAVFEAEGPVALVKEAETVDGGRVPVPGAEPVGPIPPLVELGEPQLVGPVPTGEEDEGNITVMTSLVVRSVICVVDSLVAIVVT